VLCTENRTPRLASNIAKLPAVLRNGSRDEIDEINIIWISNDGDDRTDGLSEAKAVRPLRVNWRTPVSGGEPDRTLFAGAKRARQDIEALGRALKREFD
jgi:hypothetical protein